MNQAPLAKPVYHAGEDIVNTMMANLTANNRDSSLIDAKIDDNTVAAAVPAQAKAAAPAGTPNP